VLHTIIAVMEMTHITLPEMMDYMDAISIVFPITLEIILPMDEPVQMEFLSEEAFNSWLADTAGYVGSNGMRKTLARIV